MAVSQTGLVSSNVRASSWDTQQSRTSPTSSPNLNSSSFSFNPNLFKKLKLKSLSLTKTPPQTQKPSSPPAKKDSINVSKLLKLNKPATTKHEEVDDELYMGCERWLPIPPKVNNPPRSIYNAASLAYIGDCIYELYARRHFLYPPLSIEEYNDRVMAVDALLKKLLHQDFLSEDERDVLRWGKNIDSGKTRTTKRAGVAVYNRASSLETLAVLPDRENKNDCASPPCLSSFFLLPSLQICFCECWISLPDQRNAPRGSHGKTGIYYCCFEPTDYGGTTEQVKVKLDEPNCITCIPRPKLFPIL
ncbi:hypothetical protein IFM89_021673 [Coptis chinensis]|uniref:RNase III domain-containing protein n=1 Tax=Coptis chinensis TaxID=261450 RepID=A0A835IET4_9MAGN|nr:hypothetical protein IFM89_021673 [Coptis chinensis]